MTPHVLVPYSAASDDETSQGDGHFTGGGGDGDGDAMPTAAMEAATVAAAATVRMATVRMATVRTAIVTLWRSPRAQFYRRPQWVDLVGGLALGIPESAVGDPAGGQHWHFCARILLVQSRDCASTDMLHAWGWASACWYLHCTVVVLCSLCA